jgi:osmotically-inducible protein OsmY
MNPFMLHRSRVPFAFFVAGCLAPAAAGCQRDTSSTVPPLTTASSPVVSVATKAPPPDADIARAIERHFLDEGLLRSNHMHVAVTQGIAKLSGSVDNLRAKQRALEVTESIRGVRSVIDEVSVTPVARTDAQLDSDVANALHHDSATHPYIIDVVVENGTATISGTADSWLAKRLCGEVAETVPGLKALVNNMTVHYASVRTDAEIAAEAKQHIASDVWLDEAPLKVSAAGGTVHLSGFVGSVAQKLRARTDAWVAGVNTVDDSGLTVDSFALNDQRRVSDVPFKTDAEIAKAVRDAFMIDPRLKTFVPKVAVLEGEVTLSGTVDSRQARLAAEADAKDTLGVWRVRDAVVVQPAGNPTDADIQAGSKRVLAEDPMLSNGKSIQVATVKGKVALSGTIASGFERLEAVDDVETVPGVSEIDDTLTVKLPPADIKGNIEDRLFWDPMVERDLVTVAVAPDGVATLTGTLNGWSEIKASGEDAVLGGATRVVNLLKLKDHPEVVAH